MRPGNEPTAEAWIVYERGIIANGNFAGKALSELAAKFTTELLGTAPASRTGHRFPLLIKLLDSADWLSLQVHPNDEQAKALEGQEEFGKTEAWYIIEGEPGAKILAGFKPGIRPKEMRQAILQGKLLNIVQELVVHSGDSIFIPPGTVHAIGPGLLLYEVQQSSNLTYRVFDWDRPQTGGRVLHTEKSLQVLNSSLHPHLIPAHSPESGSNVLLCTNEYFRLEMLNALERSVNQNTSGESFHALTIVEGSAQVRNRDGGVMLERFDTALVPAAAHEYEIIPNGRLTRVLKASVPPSS